MQLTWKSNFFSTKRSLFENDQLVGEIHHKTFSDDTLAYLKDVKVLIKKLNWYGSEYYIYDQVTQEQIGRAKFNFWGSKAEIFIGEQHLLFRSRNFWDSKWAIEEEGKDIVRFETKMVGGTISGEENTELLSLLGLFLINFKLQRTAAVMLIFMIIIIQ